MDGSGRVATTQKVSYHESTFLITISGAASLWVGGVCQTAGTRARTTLARTDFPAGQRLYTVVAVASVMDATLNCFPSEFF